MRLFDRRSRLQRLLDDAPVDLPKGTGSGLANVPSSRAAKAGLIAVGGVAGLTAASAGVSSLRRRREEATDN
jgi:hypothetical protein